MPRQPDLNVWKMLSIQGDQQNPAIMSQLASQAEPQAPDDSSALPMGLPPAPPPQITPAEPQDVRLSTQPTEQPLGTLPQEIVPQQQLLSPKESADWIGSQTGGAEKMAREAMRNQDMDLAKLRDSLAKYQKTPDQTDYRPFAAFVDSMTGSNFAPVAQAMAPASPQEKAKTQLEALKDINTGSGYLSKDQLDYLKSKQDVLGKLAANPAGMQLARMDLMKQRLNQQVGKEARGSVNNDKMLSTYTPRLEGAAKIGELIQSANEGKVVSNQALLGQVNAEIARLETGSQSPGLGASEKTELQDKKAQLQAYVDSISGKPSDAVRPQVLDAGNKLVKELGGSYMKAIDSRMNFIKAGMTPDQQAIADQKHQQIIKDYSPRFGGWNGLDQTKFYNGKTYKVQDGHWVEAQ